MMKPWSMCSNLMLISITEHTKALFAKTTLYKYFRMLSFYLIIIL
jgi:hypothetical protein